MQVLSYSIVITMKLKDLYNPGQERSLMAIKKRKSKARRKASKPLKRRVRHVRRKVRKAKKRKARRC